MSLTGLKIKWPGVYGDFPSWWEFAAFWREPEMWFLIAGVCSPPPWSKMTCAFPISLPSISVSCMFSEDWTLGWLRDKMQWMRKWEDSCSKGLGEALLQWASWVHRELTADTTVVPFLSSGEWQLLPTWCLPWKPSKATHEKSWITAKPTKQFYWFFVMAPGQD